MDNQDDEAAVAESVALIIDRIGERAPDVIGSIQRYLAAEVVELRGDPALLELLRASVAGNVETVFDALRYHISIERVEPPTAALEYARRVAQHGIPVNALVRAYRLGQQQVLAHVLEEIRRAGLEPEAALNTYEAISIVAFRYIDWISQQVTDAYETERERWVENRNSVRALRVRELLDSAAGSVDIDAAIAAIRYPLRRTHLAMILWTSADDAPGRELLRLERFVRDLADSMTLRDGALFVAADQVSGWGWLPLGTAATADPVEHIRRFAADSVDAPHLAMGTAQSGLEGFRRSHRQAQKARRVAVAGAQNRRVTAAGDPGVAAAALLTEDLAETREWVCETLGPLASDTDNDARLRETMRVFFGEGSSYKGAAERLNLHHNSVKYRVDRAVERRGRRIGDDRIDVEIALLVCHHLGSAVLMAAP
ncbi:PucR family transcriptional regulator [Mycobacterium sp.]|uniref:PucR family transcriptional regulator n=1 Tax=Mycobacterium sp. TaxID=1785 RepID=UPI002D0D4D35|nr:helix-turn-helix domain-containing protein [Mycobacterium sp.]HTH89271.1 helix-turn-helix domain-containing protein [Mycobacterium sp.]